MEGRFRLSLIRMRLVDRHGVFSGGEGGGRGGVLGGILGSLSEYSRSLLAGAGVVIQM